MFYFDRAPAFEALIDETKGEGRAQALAALTLYVLPTLGVELSDPAYARQRLLVVLNELPRGDAR